MAPAIAGRIIALRLRTVVIAAVITVVIAVVMKIACDPLTRPPST